MAKIVSGFFSKLPSFEKLATKLLSKPTPGSRITPSRTARNDAAYEMRIDAGELVDKRYQNIVLQVNTQAKSTILKKFLRKYGSHAVLARAAFDTKADPKTETARVMDELEEQANEYLK